MKNINLTKLVKGILVTAMVSSVLIACGKKEDNNNQINAYTRSCSNCEGITGFPFFTAQTTAYGQYNYNYSSSMVINWSFSGQNISGQTNQNYNPYYSPAMNYVGKVSAAGKVQVAAALNLGFCPQVPAGTYDLTTQTVGQWTNGQISGLRLIVTGPVTMTVTLNQAQASEYSYGYQYSTSSRIYGSLVVEQVNGYYCQGAQFNMY